MDFVKKMNVSEFRKLGYLQEVNRLFLHPLGLALEISIDDNEEESISGIWDYREDKEGITYDLKNSDADRIYRFKEKSDFIFNETEKRFKDRLELLGYKIEPIPSIGEI